MKHKLHRVSACEQRVARGCPPRQFAISRHRSYRVGICQPKRCLVFSSSPGHNVSQRRSISNSSSTIWIVKGGCIARRAAINSARSSSFSTSIRTNASKLLAPRSRYIEIRDEHRRVIARSRYHRTDHDVAAVHIATDRFSNLIDDAHNCLLVYRFDRAP
jgi:hypothetical protein